MQECHVTILFQPSIGNVFLGVCAKFYSIAASTKKVPENFVTTHLKTDSGNDHYEFDLSVF